MKKWFFIGISILGMFSLVSFTSGINEHILTNVPQPNEVTAVIDKNTTEEELEDLRAFFSENGIELLINKIRFNDKKEITGLSIILKKGNSKSQYSSSSKTPISEIELGYKNGSLYITNSGMSDVMVLRKQSGFNFPGVTMDSIMKQRNFSFDFNFDEEKDSLFFNGHMDVQKLKDQIMKSFTIEEDENGNFIFNGQNMTPFHGSKSQRFSFIDSPDIEKLIIIDGKESDFQLLDSLAKSDKLEEVDFLKPQTAISIYGKKAKDGAIIATTKK